MLVRFTQNSQFIVNVKRCNVKINALNFVNFYSTNKNYTSQKYFKYLVKFNVMSWS